MPAVVRVLYLIMLISLDFMLGKEKTLKGFKHGVIWPDLFIFHHCVDCIEWESLEKDFILGSMLLER